MNITIERDGEHVTNAEVSGLEAVPGCVFAAFQHFGSGEYVARVAEADNTGEPLFLLSGGWLEAEVDEA